MAEVVLFHHMQGLTPGVVVFAAQLRAAGHIVHTPDLFQGRRFDTIEEGEAYLEDIGGPEAVIDRGARASDSTPDQTGGRLPQPALTMIALVSNSLHRLSEGRVCARRFDPRAPAIPERAGS